MARIGRAQPIQALIRRFNLYLTTTLTKNQTLNAILRITAAVTKTLLGVLRITSSITKTLTAITRITAVVNKTLTSKVRITSSVKQTLAAIARITSSVNKTINAILRITATTSQQLSGRIRITALIIKTLGGTVRITSKTLKTIPALLRITFSAVQTISSIIRITATQVKSISGLLRVQISGQTFVNETMESSPTTGTLKNYATWINGYLRLTQAVNSENGEIEYNQLLPNAFTVDFKFWTGGGTGADALWFYFGCGITAYSEDDIGSIGYVVAFDEYGGDNAPIQIKYGGTLLASTSGAATFADSQWHNARIIVTGNTITVYLDGIQQLTYTDTSRIFPGTLFGFGARTGGFNNEHRIKNVLVYNSEGVIQGVTRITLSSLQDITGLLRIQQVVNRTLSGLSRITAQAVRNIAATLRITSYKLQHLNSVTSIVGVQNQQITGALKIKSPYGIERKRTSTVYRSSQSEVKLSDVLYYLTPTENKTSEVMYHV